MSFLFERLHLLGGWDLEVRNLIRGHHGYFANLAVPAATVAPAAVKWENAANATGLGTNTVTATISVAVPANVFAGTYSSTVTVAIVAGP